MSCSTLQQIYFGREGKLLPRNIENVPRKAARFAIPQNKTMDWIQRTMHERKWKTDLLAIIFIWNSMFRSNMPQITDAWVNSGGKR